MSKKKLFPRVDLSVPRVEHRRDELGRVLVTAEVLPPTNTKVRFPAQGNASSVRGFDFAPWYGHGIDGIVYACHRQVERFLATHDGNLSVKTVVSCCHGGLRPFLDYLLVRRVALQRDLTLDDIDRNTIDGFLAFLDDGGRKIGTRRSVYSHAKTVLVALGQRGLIRVVDTGDEATFPRNPFPNANAKAKGESPLPKAQRHAFAAAVKTAIMPLMADGAQPTSQLLACAVLITALHTGRNTTALLELGRDCLRSHPRDRTRFLVVYKRRGNSVSKVALREAPRDIDSTPAIRPNVLRVIERVMELTEPLREHAPPGFQDCIWLYRTSGGVVALGDTVLRTATTRIVRQAGLRDTNGKPLRINVSRLRKTFINRVNELLDGDIVATAAAAGNTPRVVGMHYLRPGEEAQKNWKFMGATLTHELLTSTLGATAKTPVGRCTDSRCGEFAPKRDGAVCMNFLDCLRCRNYVVTGDDLHRLFSFYWRVFRERGRMGARAWERRLAHIPRLIERDVIAEGIRRRIFKPSEVEAARERARREPHPFWNDDGVIGGLL